MEPSALPSLLALVGLVAVTALFLALRHSVQRRFALRNIRRRPWESVLVIGGSLLGAALITGSFIVGDTLDSSIRALARTQLGPIDEYVAVPDTERLDQIASAIGAIDDPRIDGVMSIVTAPAPVASDVSGETLAQPRARLLELDLEEARAFGDDPEITGISGSTPGAGEAVITDHLAATLEVEEGDPVVAYLYGREVDLMVTRVIPAVGVAGFWRGFESTSPNLLVAPGTIENILEGTDVPEGSVPPEGVVLISNSGGIEDSAELTSEVVPLVEAALPSDSPLRVEPAKRTVLDQATAEGDAFSELFLGIGSFAIIAGILLLVNIFVMLSEERKGQLGMLRAVGLRRSDLVRSFVIEGSVYAFVAGALGALLGIGVGRAIVFIAAPIFGGFGDLSLDLSFAFSWASVVGGGCLGVLIAFFTVLFTSIRIGRINIIRAIRDLPEPPKGETRRRTLIGGVLLAALSLAWFFSSLGNKDAFVGMILGPPLAAFGLLPILSRFLKRRIAVLVVAGFSLLWGVFGNALTDSGFFGSGQIFAFVFQGVLLTFSAVILLSQAQETFEGGIRRVAARNLPLRLGLAYPLAKRFRTGLTLGMYSLVIFTMAFIAVLAQVFGGQVETAVLKEGGGYDISVTSSDASPPSQAALAAVEGVEGVTALVATNALFRPDGLDDPRSWTVAGIDDSFLQESPPQLEERAEGYETDEDIWRAIATEERLVVLPIFFLQSGGGPPAATVDIGETLPLIDPTTGKETELTVIATGSAFPLFTSRATVEQALEGRAVPSTFYLTASGDVEQVAARLQGEFIENGVVAESFRTRVEQFRRANLQFLNLMQSYLALGLLVGVAGLGVVTIRSVRERRREVGVLRSLGFQPGQVRKAFTFESAFTAFEGIVVGTVLAIITAAQLVGTGEFGEGIDFVIPWTHLLVLCGSAMLASLLATAWPAQQASKIAPAVALRTGE
jgi:putative ABC transport system permease protein